MTGESTTFTIVSGYVVPQPKENSWAIMATQNYPVFMACWDFISLTRAPASLLASFQRSPIWTSCIQWFRNDPTEPKNVFPPGFLNNASVVYYNYSGECAFVIESTSVVYFFTTSYHGYPAINNANSAYTPAAKYAVVVGSTLRVIAR